MSNIEAAKQLFFEALALLDARDHGGAESRLRDALNLAPHSISILTNLSVALIEQNRPEEALTFAERASNIAPDNVEALLVMASCYAQASQFSAALETCDRIIALEPRLPEIHSNRAAALNGLHRYEDALVSCDQAIALAPNDAPSHTNRGNALLQLRRPDEALLAYDRALQLNPELAKAWAGRGHALARKTQNDDALAAFARAIELDPHLTSAWLGRSDALSLLERFEEAIAAYDKALALAPRLEHIAGARLHAKMQLCDWKRFAADCADLLSSIAVGKSASLPFPMLAIPSSPHQQRRCAEIYAAESLFQPAVPLWGDERYRHARIRVAYLSPDFGDHATAHLAASLFRLHDRSRFEITAISHGPDDRSEMRQRLIPSFDHFFDVRSESDRRVAERIRAMEIDIAVDLCGYTRHFRPNILALRPAPVQALYLGYPGTSGARHIDYLIADHVLIPPEQRTGYSEQIVYLPDSYQINDRGRKVAEVRPSRGALDLPERGFVFCCFNRNFKITPDVFDVWMRLLREVEGSVLWLLAGPDAAMVNLRREAAARGVCPSRLVFAPRLRTDLHLARHSQADLFLDTFHCGAHTTASDALWVGLPLVTCCGPTFASRVAASLLTALGLPELITSSPAEYERLALSLARDPAALAAAREKLATHRETHPLFNDVRLTRHLELAYRMMWERSTRGEPPEDMVVPALG